MVADEIKVMDESGQLKRFLKAGIVSIKVKAYYDMYRHYENELEANKKCSDCILQSTTNTSIVFNVCEKTVQRAIKAMKS